MKLFDLGTSPINTFFFLHKELIGILDQVFTGFMAGEHRFFQPDSDIFAAPYDFLITRYSQLFRDDEVVEYIKHKDLVITNIDLFRSLSDDFDLSIKFWNSWRSNLLLEKQACESLLPSDDGVEREIKLTAYELMKRLPEHVRQKKEFLGQLQPKSAKKSLAIFFDEQRSTLTIGNETHFIQLTTKPYVFLKTILDFNGTVAGYKRLADALDLNSVRPEFTNKDIAPEVHEQKKLLRKKLKEDGFSEKHIIFVMRSIQSVRGVGYRFIPYQK